MSSYLGRHADLYDVFYADKPYREEARFVHACLQRFGMKPGQPLLELACGTGRTAVEMEKLGYQVVATDYSEDMLACARRRARAAGSQCVFHCQDMRQLNLPGQTFDAAICLFDSIGYAQDDESIVNTLRGVRDHLAPGGVFVFEFWHAEAMLRHFDPVRVRRWPVPAGTLLRISETVLDPEKHLAHVTYTIFEPRPDGGYTGLLETQTNRYFLVPEMAGLLEKSGLVPRRWFDGYSAREIITDNTWHVLAVAQKQ